MTNVDAPAPAPAAEAPRFLDIPALGVVLLTLLYVTGFIVVFAHNERLGLVTVPSDFFQLRYLHVGVLACAFLGICTATSFQIALSLATPDASLRSDKLARLAQLAMVLFVTIGIYTLLALAPPRSLSYGALLALALFGAMATFHLWRMQWRERRSSTANANQSPTRKYDHTLLGWLLRGVLLVLSLVFFVFEVGSVPWPTGGWWIRLTALVALCFLMGAALGRLAYTRSRDRTEHGAWTRRVAPFVLLLAFWYYVIVYGFSIVVYAHIPLAKGGGDFSDAVPVWIRLAEDAAQSLSDAHAVKQPVVVILESSEFLYVAPDPGREARRKWGSEHPVEYYAVPRGSVAAIAPCHGDGAERDGVHASQVGKQGPE